MDQYREKFEENHENGHSVISFGEVYSYSGAKALTPCSKEFPEIIDEVASQIKEKFPSTVINQCLINRCQDNTASLPKHSDNESCIVHGSEIFTVSIGGTCDVKFSKIAEPDSCITQTVEGNSLYVMSKQSQNSWHHRIDPSTEPRQLRYSITFRYISSNNNEATIILGDSNTRFLKFGNGKKTFGNKLPGKRVECFTIDKIDPNLCVGYRNVFIHCGVNSIKGRDANVPSCVNDLVSKLDRICELCPYARVTVSPILPTKFARLNEKAILFNDMLFKNCSKNPRIGTLDFSTFVDSESGLLSEEFGRYRNPNDGIHLGSTGIYTLSRLIVKKVFGSPTDGRTYSEMVKIPVQRGPGMSSQYKPRRRRSVILPS
jgi:hypothetical protein